jgi:predicted amidohydrolase YtcJ
MERRVDDTSQADLILNNGRFTNLDPAKATAMAVAVRAGKFVAVGREWAVTRFWGRARRSSTSKVTPSSPA